MAITSIDGVTATGTISPVFTSGTGNNVNNVRAFAQLRALADVRSAEFRAGLLDDDDNQSIFSNTELLSLNSQSLDILNGVNGTSTTTSSTTASSTEDALDISNQLTDQEVVAAIDAQTNIAPASTLPGLTLQQRENLSSIINEFANAPFDQNTFLQIQDALVAARINPQQISLQAILQEVFSGAMPNYMGKTRVNTRTYEVEAA